MERRLRESELEAILRILHGELLRSLEQGWGGPFAAAAVRDGRPIALGTNTVLRDRDASRHAEVNALAGAGALEGGVPMRGVELVTTHFPCLMCYHAVKWAGVRRLYYVFDYEETERLFGFTGDRRLLADLNLETRALLSDPSLEAVRVSGKAVEELLRGELVAVWNAKYRSRLLAYDIAG